MNTADSSNMPPDGSLWGPSAPDAETSPTAMDASNYGAPDPPVDLQTSTTNSLMEMNDLLRVLEGELDPDAVGDSSEGAEGPAHLDIARTLYVALRCKHPESAAHGLRVALICSAWARHLGVGGVHRLQLETAGLLHDIGWIGLPDQILLKPGPLSADEVRIIHQSRRMGLQILRSASIDEPALEIVEHVGAWYDGSRPGFSRGRDEIPLGARMIYIVEAFDSMTTDHVYRPAMSQERAIAELFAFSGNQFDPRLVKSFVDFYTNPSARWQQEVARRWLGSIDREVAQSIGTPSPRSKASVRAETRDLFVAKLLAHMLDAVVFVDAAFRFIEWNSSAERLTGIKASSLLGKTWDCSVIGLQNETGKPIAKSDCPIFCAMQSGVPSLRRMRVRGRNDRQVYVDGHAIPVANSEGTIFGAMLILHDATERSSLEIQCQTLHDRATKDPMTQVTNRCEFERIHELFIESHRQLRMPCSLVICDLDYFKQINDTFGHQAGDSVLKTMAGLLKSYCLTGDLLARPGSDASDEGQALVGGDVVVRYGGEEFVILCANCDNATAMRRAEEIRRGLSELAISAIEGQSVTASFGVTELQPGDTIETMLRRADRALMLAKKRGRNMVVQLGSGVDSSDEGDDLTMPDDAATDRSTGLVMQRVLASPIPPALVSDKLNGFIADHRADVLARELVQGRLLLQLAARDSDGREERGRGTPSHGPVLLLAELQWNVRELDQEGDPPSGPRTRIEVTIRPKQMQAASPADFLQRAQSILVSLRTYLNAATAAPVQVDAPPRDS